ncbi:hypothetical protein GWK47_041507 [Chionoecetes opilio]|uniref:Uncharacterized protein n=1 Tax=Chionoecetes opilio TaxID=41210 RepID=A0A8J5CX60_CHIOP|nr:hypothetical protein GWK47_041507 [Chionoecetes opilio]
MFHQFTAATQLPHFFGKGEEISMGGLGYGLLDVDGGLNTSMNHPTMTCDQWNCKQFQCVCSSSFTVISTIRRATWTLVNEELRELFSQKETGHGKDPQPPPQAIVCSTHAEV